jgi:hypothetical protein
MHQKQRQDPPFSEPFHHEYHLGYIFLVTMEGTPIGLSVSLDHECDDNESLHVHFLWKPTLTHPVSNPYSLLTTKRAPPSSDSLFTAIRDPHPTLSSLPLKHQRLHHPPPPLPSGRQTSPVCPRGGCIAAVSSSSHTRIRLPWKGSRGFWGCRGKGGG